MDFKDKKVIDFVDYNGFLSSIKEVLLLSEERNARFKGICEEVGLPYNDGLWLSYSIDTSDVTDLHRDSFDVLYDLDYGDNGYVVRVNKLLGLSEVDDLIRGSDLLKDWSSRLIGDFEKDCLSREFSDEAVQDRLDSEMDDILGLDEKTTLRVVNSWIEKNMDEHEECRALSLHLSELL